MRAISLIKKNVATLLIIAGIIIMVLSIFATLKWKLLQEQLINEYDENINESISRENGELDTQTIQQEETLYDDTRITQRTVEERFSREDYKDGMMMIAIPKLKVRAAIVDGTAKESLKEGPGLYEISPLPSQEGGNVCIAGHRTTYGAWFRHVDTLIKGDVIILEFNGFKYFYKVEGVFVIKKNDWSVTESLGYSAITLTACHPLGSAKQRIVVRAKLDKINENDKVTVE